MFRDYSTAAAEYAGKAGQHLLNGVFCLVLQIVKTVIGYFENNCFRTIPQGGNCSLKYRWPTTLEAFGYIFWDKKMALALKEYLDCVKGEKSLKNTVLL